MKFLSRLDDFEHIVIDGSVSGTGLSSLYLKDTATPILRIGNNTGDSFITYDGSELSISSDVDLRLTTPTDQDVFLITSSGNIVTTQAGGTFTIGGGLTLSAITGGFLKTDANGVVSVDNSSYLTNETDTLDSVTGRGNTTTNDIGVGAITLSQSSSISGAMLTHYTNNYVYLRGGTEGAILSDNSGNNTIQVSGAGNYIRFETSNGSERMRITNTGNVGIGTTSPTNNLHVVGNTRVGSLLVGDSAASNTPATMLHIKSSGTNAVLRIEDSDNFNSYYDFLVDEGNGLYFKEGSTSRLFIQEGGNVGIGTTSPSEKLDVVGSIRSTGNEGKIKINSTATNGKQYEFISIDTGNLGLYDGTAYRFWVGGNGNIGIGTVSPSQKLHVVGKALITDDVQLTGSNPRLDFNSNGASSLRFYDTTNATERMRINESGNVGIGDTAPSFILDVNNTSSRVRFKAATGDSNLELSSIAGRDWLIQSKADGVFRIYDEDAAAARLNIDTSGNIQLPAYGAGILTTDASGNVSVDTSAYLTSYTETQTLDDVTTLGATTANAIQIGGFTATGATNYIGTEEANNGTTTLVLRNYDTTLVDAGDIQGRIQFTGRYWSGATSQLVESRIEHGHQESNGNGGSFLRFLTQTGGSGPVEQMRIDKVGNVGIGTTSPADKLQVQGNLAVPAGVIYNGFAANSAGLGLNNAYFDASGYYGIRFFSSLATVGSQTERMRITNTGNVGIGTTAPGNKLHIKDGASGFAGTFDSRYKSIVEASGEAYYATYVPDNSFTGIRFNNTSGLKGYIDYYHGTQGDALVYSATNHHRFSIGGLEKMRLSSAGNLGIGTSNPSYTLHVGGTGYVSDDLLVGVGNAASWHRVSIQTGGFIAQSGNKGVGVYSDANANSEELFAYDYTASSYIPLKIRTSTLNILNQTGSTVLYHNGTNVGISTTNIVQPLTVQAASNANTIGLLGRSNDNNSRIDFLNNAGNSRILTVLAYDSANQIYGDTNIPLTISTNAAERMRITGGGNVGINTSNPGERLDVVGNIRSYSAANNYGQIQNGSFLAVGNHGGTFMLDLDNNGTADLVNIKKSGTSRFYIENGGNVGIGTTNPVSKLHVVGEGDTVTLQKSNNVPALAFLGTSTNKSLIEGGDNLNFFTGGSSRLYITNGGNVGIGTTPSSWGTGFLGLDLGGSAAANIGGGARTRFASNLYYDGSNFKYKNNYGGSYYFQDAVNINHTWGTAVTGTGGATATLVERMRIDSSGNVGIGTTSPNNKLDVRRANSGIVAEFHSTAGTSDEYVDVKLISGNTTAGTYGTILRHQRVGTDGADFAILTNPTLTGTPVERFRITRDGDVGIGTAAPNVKLEIKGNASENVQLRLQTDGSATEEPTILFRRNSSAYGEIKYRADGGGSQGIHITDYRSDASNIIFKTAGSNERMRISHTGNVGIGTTSPGDPLHIVSSGNDDFIRIENTSTYTGLWMNDSGSNSGWLVMSGYTDTPSPGDFTIREYGVQTSLTIKQTTGNVGIGTTSPATKLHVVGTAETRLRVGSSNASSNVVLELVDENSPTTQGTVITYNNSTGETYFNNVYTPATTDFHFQSGAYGTATDFFSLSNAGGNSILHLSTVLGDAFITYENSTNEMELSSDGDLRLTTPTDQDVFFISSGGNIDMTQAGGTVDMGGDLVVSGDGVFNSKVGIGTATPSKLLTVGSASTTSGIFNDGILVAIDGGAAITAKNNVNSVEVQMNAETSQGTFGTFTNHPVAFRVNNSNKMWISTNGNIGIGTTNPNYKLDVSGTSRIGGTSSNLALFVTSTSTFGAAISFEDVNTGGNDVVHAGAKGSGFYIATNYSENFLVSGTGNVGIGTSNPVYKLDVSGTIRATGDVIAYSDARVKENVETIPNALDKVKAMRGVGYNKIGEEKRSVGVIAQELLEVLPEAVHQDENGMYSVAYGNIVGVLIESIKELEAKVEQLENKLNGSTK